jgi:1,4-dihydroxy-2-naphthoate octaprenyltransferase
MLGFGMLTPIAGWGLTGQPLTGWFWKISIGFGFLFGALYPATQIYQVEEDKARGDRTLVIKLGITKSLVAAALMELAAHAMFVWAAIEKQPRVTLGSSMILSIDRVIQAILLSCVPWSIAMIQWTLRWRSMSQAQNEKMMYAFLMLWAITEIIILWLFWPRL